MVATLSRRRCLQAAVAAGLHRAWPVRAATAAAPALVVLHADGLRASLLQGPWLEPAGTQPLPSAMHRWVAPGLAGGADGTLVRLDGPRATVSARRAGDGAEARAARSSDGRWVALLPGPGDRLELLDERLQTVGRWPLPGPAAWIADAPRRRAFVLSLVAPPQVWLVSYDPRAEDFYAGLVHDFRMGEGVPQRAFLNPRRVPLPEPLIAATADAEDTEFAGTGLVVNLDVRRIVARLPALQPPGAGTAAGFVHRGAAALAAPRAGRTGLLCLRCGDWQTLAEPETPVEVGRVLAWPAAGQLLALPARPASWLARVELDSLTPIPPLTLPAPALAFGLGDGGRALAVACEDSTLRVWRADTPGDGRMHRLPVLLDLAPVTGAMAGA